MHACSALCGLMVCSNGTGTFAEHKNASQAGIFCTLRQIVHKRHDTTLSHQCVRRPLVVAARPAHGRLICHVYRLGDDSSGSQRLEQAAGRDPGLLQRGLLLIFPAVYSCQPVRSLGSGNPMLASPMVGSRHRRNVKGRRAYRQLKLAALILCML
jgi:hypothetical protein